MRRFSVYCLLVGLTIAESSAYAVTGGAINVYFHVIRRSPGIAAATPNNVLLPGDIARVVAWAQVPEDAFAFAEAEFEVEAEPGLPGWIVVSDGVIDGPSVHDIFAGQPHDPAEGIFADPSNPIRIWTGTYAPVSYETQLVRVQATPSAFSYYPSASTSTSVECEASPGEGWMFVNPLSFGDWLVAPGAGTTIEAGAGLDVLIANTGYDREELQLGLIAPAGSPIRVEPESPPGRLIHYTGLEDGTSPISGLRVTFSEAIDPHTYQLLPEWFAADAYEYHVILSAFAGQTVRIRIQAADAAGASLNVQRLPNVYSSRTYLDRRANETHVVSRLGYDRPVRVITPDGRVLRADGVEVHAVLNNLKQLGIGCHVFESAHTGGGNFVFSDGSVQF